MIDFDTTVTGEEVWRDDDGNVEKLKLKHFKGGQRYWTKIVVEDGEPRFESFAPIRRDGRTITSTKKISFFDQNELRLVDFEMIQQLLASASKYAREVYDVDVGRHIYIGESEAGER